MFAIQRCGTYPTNAIRNELDRLFTGLFEDRDFGPLQLIGARRTAALNLWENDEQLVVEVEVPGWKMEDLEVLIEGHELTIKGRAQEESQTKPNATYHRRERALSEFVRIVSLPATVNSDNVKAELRDGILTVSLPKTPEARARKVTVTTTG